MPHDVKLAREWTTDRFTGAVNSTVRDLRELADTIERISKGIERVPSPGQPSAVSVAADIVSKLHNTLANSGVQQIIVTASAFDEAVTYHIKESE